MPGQVDLVAAVRPVAGVEQALSGGGAGLRPQVEEALPTSEIPEFSPTLDLFSPVPGIRGFLLAGLPMWPTMCVRLAQMCIYAV